MKKLYEKNTIDTWKKIVSKITYLNFTGSSREYIENIEVLKFFLSGLDLSLDSLVEQPKTLDEIGVGSLVHTIYASDANKYYKKANFYEKIYALDKLGIRNVEFNPTGIEEKKLKLTRYESDGALIINKIYTDGIFSYKKVEDESGKEIYLLENLENANYLFEVELQFINDEVIIRKANAVLTSFNGNYPSKEEIMSRDFAKIISDMEDNPNFVHQSFNCLEVGEEVLADRKLVLEDDEQYVYLLKK